MTPEINIEQVAFIIMITTSPDEVKEAEEKEKERNYNFKSGRLESYGHTMGTNFSPSQAPFSFLLRPCGS